MGAFTGATHFFNISLEKAARNLGYAEDNILILTGDIETLQRDYPNTYENILSCAHHADNRTPMAYAQDLVASWLIEDSILSALNQNGLTAKLDGADNNRQILSSSKTSTSSDFLVSYNGKTRKLELMNDYTGFWSRSGKLHLRDNKYQNMIKEQSLFLAVSMTTKEFALFDFEDSINATYISAHRPYGYKPAYELSIPSSIMQHADSKTIVDAIKQHI